MDTDLFQGVLLGLLAVGLVVLVALLATLGGIRRALEQRSGPRTSPIETGGAEAETTVVRTEPDPTETQAAQPASGYTGAGSYATPVATASAGTGRADSIRSVLQEHGVGGAGEPAAAMPSAEEPVVEEPVVDSAFAAHADDPQEEPFQRDGRWWFRRGNELLLYDESSGQWQPAPEGQMPGASGETPSAAAGGQIADAVTTTSTQTMPAVADQVATFWKCPTCGAVNGSTAATCRMCFAARP